MTDETKVPPPQGSRPYGTKVPYQRPPPPRYNLGVSSERAEALTENIAKLIAHKRVECGLSKRQLALMSGLSRSAIRMIEEGDRCPTVFTLSLISDALEVSPSELVREAECAREKLYKS